MPLPTLLGSLPRFKTQGHSRRKLRLEACEERCTPALFIDVGTHTLLPDTNGQRIDIFLTSDDLANDPQIELMNLFAEIGDAPHRGGAGFDPYPNFDDVDFSGGIWDEFPNSPLDQTPGSTPFHAEGWVIFDSSSSKVDPDGKIVTLIVDTTGFTSGEYPLKFTDVGNEFGGSFATNFAYSQFNPSTNSTDIIEADVTITNGTIRIASSGAAPVVDLNGSGAGTGFDAFYDEGDSPISIVGTSGGFAADISDTDSTTLASATITLANVQDGTSELLAADTSGTGISAQYNANSNTLTLNGTDTLANYEQVLRSLTYENTAATLTPAIRTVSVVVNDGATASDPAVANVTAYDSSFPWHNTADPTNVDDGATGTTINDALLIVADLRSNGTRQLPPTTPAGSFNFIDTDRNNRSTINDALVVVAELRNAQNGGGEGEPMGKSATDQCAPASKSLNLNDSDFAGNDTDDSTHDLAMLALLAEDD